MTSQYITINRLLRSIASKCWDGVDAERMSSDGYASIIVWSYIQREVAALARLWPDELDRAPLAALETCAAEGTERYEDLAQNLLPPLSDAIDSYYSNKLTRDAAGSILDLLHPRIISSSYVHFRNGHYREAVLNALVAVFDFIRERTGLDLDGADLANRAFSTQRPYLRIADLTKESGLNEQKGFILLLQGAYQGVRNPKAHSLLTDITSIGAMQYLTLASLLARRVEEATLSSVENPS